MEHATLRVAPNSTYKIYDALFGLEEEIITPENSFIAWNGETYPFEAWNADLLWSSFFVTLLAKKYHYSIMQLPLLHAG